MRSPEGRIPVSGRFSRIRDDFGDPLGILFVGCELVQIERIGTIYGLTCREKQIVDELATGNPNREIAEVLGISENTIKAHITNIYNKLCITNRIELLNLLEGFTVVPETVALPAAFTAERD